MVLTVKLINKMHLSTADYVCKRTRTFILSYAELVNMG
jgi:hypothetical protein